MPKRPNDEELSPSPSGSLSPPASPSPRKLKRPKKTVDDDTEVPNSESSSNADFSVHEIEEEDEGLNSPIAYARDQDYYFEDGSVTLRVSDILFKVQRSLLVAHSEVFDDMFTMPLGTGNEPIEGTCDEHPIVIPGVEPAQFRNLMKMFYCPPSDKLFIALHICDKNKEKVWENFQFYLDVARLSHRFGMSNMEKWANGQLRCLIHASAEGICFEAGDDATTCFMDALWYSMIVSDQLMTRDIRSMIQFYCDQTANCTSIALFKSPNLREKDPVLFGFLFLLLLDCGPDIWKTDPLTQMDRMAFFSAQVYLTPLPSALLEGLQTPLFVRPTSANDFLPKLWNDPTKKSCNDKCRRTIFLHWLNEFNSGYYSSIASQQARTVFTTLVNIPSHRLQLANKIRSQQCARNCYLRVLKWLDRDTERLYTRIAEYYQEIK